MSEAEIPEFLLTRIKEIESLPFESELNSFDLRLGVINGIREGFRIISKPENLARLEYVALLERKLEIAATRLSYITDEANGKKECHQMAKNALKDLDKEELIWELK